MSQYDVDGWSVIVTGGASGIGAATARLLARSGARVTVADFNRDGIADIAVLNSASGTMSILLGKASSTLSQ